MNWDDWARVLGERPTEVALTVSFLLASTLTLAIGLTERARPLLKAGFNRRRFFRGEATEAAYHKIDNALVLLALSLLGVFGGGSVFLHLVEGVLENTWLPRWDALFIETVHRTVTDMEVRFFSAITVLAGRPPPYLIGALMAVLLYTRRHFVLLAVWLGGLMGNALLSEVLKQFFSRSRPVLDQPFLVEDNFSFPSGHAMTSILLYGLLAYVCSREFFHYKPFHRHLMIWALSFSGVLIGTSRLVLGVHYPSDVVAGWCVASCWLALVVLVAETLRGRFGPVSRLRPADALRYLRARVTGRELLPPR